VPHSSRSQTTHTFRHSTTIPLQAMAEKAQEQVQRIHQLLRVVKILPREVQSGCKQNHQTVKFSGPALLMTRVAKCSPLNENVLMMKGPRPTPKKQGIRC